MTNQLKLTGLTMKKSDRPKKKKIASLDQRKARAGWIFVLPFVIGFVLVYLPMLVDSIRLSFMEITYVRGETVETFVGLQNYSDALFKDVKYLQTLINGIKQILFDLPAILIFSLFMAVLLNQKMVGRAAFRAIFFVPVVLSTGIMEVISAQDILNQHMSSGSGIDDGSGSSAASDIVSAMDMEKLFSSMKIGTELATYVSDLVNNIFQIVNRSGVQMLIFLAALQSVSPAIYESCRIDGATSWETFWKITLPMISPMILVNGVYTLIDSFTTDSNVVMNYVSQTYSGGKQVLSSAMAWLYFAIIILMVGIVAAIFSAFVFYQKRDM